MVTVLCYRHKTDSYRRCHDRFQGQAFHNSLVVLGRKMYTAYGYQLCVCIVTMTIHRQQVYTRMCVVLKCRKTALYYLSELTNETEGTRCLCYETRKILTVDMSH
jgi:hypothetical protein